MVVVQTRQWFLSGNKKELSIQGCLVWVFLFSQSSKELLLLFVFQYIYVISSLYFFTSQQLCFSKHPQLIDFLYIFPTYLFLLVPSFHFKPLEYILNTTLAMPYFFSVLKRCHLDLLLLTAVFCPSLLSYFCKGLRQLHYSPLHWLIWRYNNFLSPVNPEGTLSFCVITG